MKESDYRAAPGCNWSTVKHALKSGLHYQHFLSSPPPAKKEWALGRGAHMAVLEWERFCTEVAVWTGKVRRGKEWDAFSQEAEENGQEILTAKENAECIKIRAAVMAHDDARSLLSGATTEKSFFWTDERTGLRCKGRADFINGSIFGDLKTARDVSPRAFGRAFCDYLYHAQFAFYIDGLRANGVELDDDARVITVESCEPHDGAVYRIPPALIEVGRELYRSALDVVASGSTAGCCPGVMDLEVPPWVMPAGGIENELDFGEVRSGDGGAE